MSEVPLAKRARTSSTTQSSATTQSPSLPLPILADDIKRIPLAACHALIYEMMVSHPAHSSLIASRVPPPIAKPPPVPKGPAPIPPKPKNGPPIDFTPRLEAFESEINTYYPAKKIGKASTRITDDMFLTSIEIADECQGSNHYSTRLSALSTLIKMGMAIFQSDNEDLTFEMLDYGVVDPLEQGMEEVMKLMEPGGEEEVEKMKKDGIRTAVKELDYFYRSRGITNAFEDLAEMFGVVDGEDSENEG